MKRKTAIKRTRPLRKTSEKGKEVKALLELVRKIVLLRDRFTCLRCGKRPMSRQPGGQALVLQAAHIYGQGAHPRMRFITKNVICLCKGCHFWWHRHGFGREAAKENAVRKWCIETLGQERMDYLDMVAGYRARRKAPDLKAWRLALEDELERMIGGAK